jgi:hypothetical protein
MNVCGVRLNGATKMKNFKTCSDLKLDMRMSDKYNTERNKQVELIQKALHDIETNFLTEIRIPKIEVLLEELRIELTEAGYMVMGGFSTQFVNYVVISITPPERAFTL